MKYYIIAGEASGDLHGSNLIKELKCQDPEAEFRFWGGDKMEEASGTAPTMHYRNTAIMGFSEVIKKYRTIKGFFRLCKQEITQWNPDCVVFIDYPGFNLRIAKWAHCQGFKTFYYIAPKVWAWKEYRVKSIKKYIDRMFVIFPFEVEWFRERGVRVKYVGNPLLDELSALEKPTHSEKIIALVAGSRRAEVKHNLPAMIKTLENLPDHTGVITGVDWLPKELYQNIIGDNQNIRIEYGKTYDIMSRAEAALVTSGTATLEAALLNLPQVVGYRGPSFNMAVARLLLTGRIRWISLVNIIMNRTVVNELVGNKVFVEKNATVELQKILPTGSQHARIIAEYNELRTLMGETGASRRCAQGILEEL
ncbi:MAG: lipid-A-disaccharide synthase [Rikenellaceae bacterium]